MSNIIKPSNDELIELIQSYGIENEVEVLSSVEAQDGGGITLDVDQGFIEEFENKYPGVMIDEVLQTFFEQAITNFTEQMKEDPEFAKEVQDFQNKSDK